MSRFEVLCELIEAFLVLAAFFGSISFTVAFAASGFEDWPLWGIAVALWLGAKASAQAHEQAA